MEDTHWAYNSEVREVAEYVVLILVLMEDTHWEKKFGSKIQNLLVLILVLMEDTHWE